MNIPVATIQDFPSASKWQIVRKIKQQIDWAKKDFAEELAINVANKAKEIAVTKTRNPTGKLADSIEFIKIVANKNEIRYHVVTGVPYAPWIEFGAGTPEGLPYSSPTAQGKYGKDYTTSSFTGIKFMSGGLQYWANKSRYGPIFVEALAKRLSTITNI